MSRDANDPAGHGPPSSPSSPSSPALPALGESVTRLERSGKELFLVGTAHVSRRSVEEVERVIRELRPSAVCVELDAARYETLVDETRFQRLDVRAVLREGRAGLMLASLLFSAFQKRLGDRLGVRPGAEMLAAVAAAKEVGAEVVLADRDVQATLRRCHESLGALDRVKVFLGLAFLPFAAAEVNEADVERLKGREAIGDAMTAFAQQMPALKAPLIDERDQYLILSTREAPGPRVVSVVGAAHVAGMVQNLDVSIDRAQLTAIPPPSAGSRGRAWILPVLFGLIILAAAARGDGARVLGVALRAGGVAAACSAALVLGAGGRLTAALAAFVTAPVTLALPFAPLGRLVGEIQARARPPSPADGGAVRADMLVPSRLRKNRFIVVLLVTLMAPLGRSLGGVVGLLWALLSLRH